MTREREAVAGAGAMIWVVAAGPGDCGEHGRMRFSISTHQAEYMLKVLPRIFIQQQLADLGGGAAKGGREEGGWGGGEGRANGLGGGGGGMGLGRRGGGRGLLSGTSCIRIRHWRFFQHQTLALEQNESFRPS